LENDLPTRDQRVCVQVSAWGKNQQARDVWITSNSELLFQGLLLVRKGTSETRRQQGTGMCKATTVNESNGKHKRTASSTDIFNVFTRAYRGNWTSTTTHMSTLRTHSQLWWAWE